MSCLRLWSPLCTWVAVGAIVVLLQGCRSVSSPDSLALSAQDDFGRIYGGEEINVETVGRDTMIFERAQLDLAVRGVFPVETNFKPGVGFGTKFSVEVAKSLYLGLSFDWSHHEVDEGVDQIVDIPSLLSDTESDQFYESLDRMDFLLNFDYDIRLDDPRKGNRPWRVRLGFGIGPLLIVGEEDRFVKDQIRAAGGSFSVEPYLGMAIRPQVELRHQILDYGHLFVTGGFDWAVFPNEIDVKINGERREVEDSIEFSAGMIVAGFAFEW